MNESDGLFQFSEWKSSPDPFYGDYRRFRGESVPLIIDNGAFQCRAGWAAEDTPRLVFRNLIAKAKSRKEGDTSISIGNDIGNLEVMRWALRTQFDRNLVTHYDAQEQVFDHVFGHLGVDTDGSVDHPLVLTEPVCNPGYCRGLMSELLFECYGIPSVLYGVDALFSLYCNSPPTACRNALIVSCGHQTTHVLPVVNGRMDAHHCKRINIGGAHCVGYMQRLLQLKYPAHLQTITLTRAQELVNCHSYIATNYQQELLDWQQQRPHPQMRCIQLPFVPIPTEPIDATAQEEKEKQRKAKQGQRLQEANARRRQEKLHTLRKELDQLLDAQYSHEQGYDGVDDILLQFGLQAVDELPVAIEKTKRSIANVEQQIARAENPDGDDADSRKRSGGKLNGAAKAKRLCESKLILGKIADPLNFDSETQWVASLHSKHQELIDRRKQRLHRRQQLSKRHSHASHERMRIIAELAQDKEVTDSRGKVKEDTFGMNDEDWHVYRSINKEGDDSDSEREEAQFQEIEHLLLTNDPEFAASKQPMMDPSSVAASYQLNLEAERFRVPELLFQPSMLGADQAGVADTIEFVLKAYDASLQSDLVQNVFITGGNSLFPNFKERLEHELLAMRPFKSTFSIFSSSDPLLDAWCGAKKFAVQEADFPSLCISKAEYLEKGADFLREHTLSNVFIRPDDITNQDLGV